MAESRGFSGLEYKISQDFDINIQELERYIKEIYIRFITYDKKAVFFYQIDPSTINKLENLLLNIVDTNNKNYKLYIQEYPLPIEDDLLNDIYAKESFAFIKTENILSANEIIVSSCVKKFYKINESIDLEEVSDNLKQQYSSIKGIKEGVIQSFEQIRFNKKTGIIQIYIDLSPKIVISDALDYIDAVFLSLLKTSYENLHKHPLDIKKIDIFDKIKKLYDESDGLVYALHHETPSGSGKQEKMGKKTDDLRDEDFHSAGVKAISNQTKLYRIYKIYSVSNNYISIEIPGDLRTLHNPSSKLNYAIFHDCIKLEQINFLAKKLLY